MGELMLAKLNSRSLRKDVPYCLWLPRDTEPPNGRWPLLLVLHGRGRNERSLSEQPGVMDSLRSVPFAVAFPRGDDGWWIDSPANRDDRYGSMLLEFIDHLEKTHPVGGGRDKRAVTGWSMGGFGAVTFAESHPQMVGSVSSMIGLLNLPLGDSYQPPEKTFGPKSDSWPTLSPVSKVTELRGEKVAVYSCSDGFDRPHNEAFHAAMERAGIPHHYEILPGGHTMSTVLAAWPKVLAFHADTWK